MTQRKNITSAATVSTMLDSDYVLVTAGGALKKIALGSLGKSLSDSGATLESLAFYIDVNKPSSRGATRVDCGGNMLMRATWEAESRSVLMDANGNYCELNPNDGRYTAEGDSILDSDGNLVSQFAHCDLMKIIPKTYVYIQDVDIAGIVYKRTWLSLVPIPGGSEIPQQVVGKFKCYEENGALRSIPNRTPATSKTIYGFWQSAQARSKNHGLANLDFRNYLLYYMMSKYGWRDSQNCKTSDNTLVWGVGLDGSEQAVDDKDGFARQRYINTGATLVLGDNDGNSIVKDSNGLNCHSVNVNGFENPWGQYWEFVQGLCSVGTSDVYLWRSNFVPPTDAAPTVATFANISHEVLARKTSNGSGSEMNVIVSGKYQGVHMIPQGSKTGISYGDGYYYESEGKTGQVWLWGGSSHLGSACGLVYSYSHHAWSVSPSAVSARLAYYGNVRKVSARVLAQA